MKTTEELLVYLLNTLAEQVRERLILKGGMLLRLLESPRSTQDLDFVLVSKKSKKVLVQEILSILKELPNIRITNQELNSRGIILDVEEIEGKVKGILEFTVSASTYLPPEPISTAKLSSRYSWSGRIISTMALPEAFSNKLAACIERGAMRDLYDLSLLEPMTQLDIKTLKGRLDRIEINRTKPKKITVAEAKALLQKKLDGLSEEKLRDEIYPLLPKEYRTGLLTLIRASFSRIIQKLELLL